VTKKGRAHHRRRARHRARDGAAVARRGWLVGAVDCRRAELAQPSASSPPRRADRGDIGDEATAKRAVTDTIERFGQLDGVVSNAGIMIRKPIRQLTIAEWRRVLDVNLTAAFLLAKAAEKPLRQTGAPSCRSPRPAPQCPSRTPRPIRRAKAGSWR
jgi:NAD(P)-dependent dehydrogenase (short-subunit alcohol dehydrogenase family)